MHTAIRYLGIDMDLDVRHGACFPWLVYLYMCTQRRNQFYCSCGNFLSVKVYGKENPELLQERGKSERPLRSIRLETLTLDMVASDDQRLLPSLYFCSILRFTLLPW